MNRDYERGRSGEGYRDRERWDREREGRWPGEQRFGGYESGFGGDNRFSGGEDRWASREGGRDWDRDRDWSERGLRGFGGPQWGNESYTGGRDWDRMEQSQRGGYGVPMQRGGYGYGGGYGMSNERLGGMNWSERRRERIGRGPKNYQRSDERIREDVCDLLSDHDWLDASDVEVTVKAGEVSLVGTVRDRQSKRLVEDIAEQARGVKDVHNQLRVQQEPREGAQPQRTDGGRKEERAPRA